MQSLHERVHEALDEDAQRQATRRAFLLGSAKLTTAGALAVTLGGHAGMQRLVAAQEGDEEEDGGIGAPGRQGGGGQEGDDEIDSSADQIEEAVEERTDENGGGEDGTGENGDDQASDGIGAPGRQGGRGDGTDAPAADGGQAGATGGGQAGATGSGLPAAMPEVGTGSAHEAATKWSRVFGFSAVVAAGAAVFTRQRARAEEPVKQPHS